MNRFQRRREKQRSQPRPLRDGDVVIVLHSFPNGETVEYRAVIRFASDGRCLLEKVKTDDHRIARTRVHYHSTFPIPGYADWFMISAIPILLSRFARIGSPIRRLMQNAPYSE